MTYDNTNKGIIGKNTRKEQDSHPDLSGSINVDGKDYWLSGWRKARNDGTGFFYSLAVKPKEQRQEQRSQPAQTSALPDDLTDDIPF